VLKHITLALHEIWVVHPWPRSMQFQITYQSLDTYLFWIIEINKCNFFLFFPASIWCQHIRSGRTTPRPRPLSRITRSTLCTFSSLATTRCHQTWTGATWRSTWRTPTSRWPSTWTRTSSTRCRSGEGTTLSAGSDCSREWFGLRRIHDITLARKAALNPDWYTCEQKKLEKRKNFEKNRRFCAYRRRFSDVTRIVLRCWFVMKIRVLSTS